MTPFSVEANLSVSVVIFIWLLSNPTAEAWKLRKVSLFHFFEMEFWPEVQWFTPAL